MNFQLFISFLFFSYAIIEIIQIPSVKYETTLPCLFKDIVDQYPESQLQPCKTESQKWKHASAPAAVVRINKLAKYFSELSLLNNCLENYSICVNHYNQIVATNNYNFYQSLSFKFRSK